MQGEKTVGKANKGVNVGKIIIGLKIKIKEEKKKRKLHRTVKAQKPNVEAEVYNSNKKCD